MIFLKYYEFPVILVATKADKLAKSKKTQTNRTDQGCFRF
ncbi:hypothetical protein TMUPMC115_1441 [Tetragenococcus muriaticus PMC-11-5]|uniref:GTP-binding protein EngB n=1 Tax=Tetragenococcus muriaticus PMC-11-5 TaxID=1302649 RepID=A0A091CD25_9ENTE|nr:hypothetical protein TMUPMC115_1441 [Tetragenococcus muriaticus PMC-11-5]